MNENTTIRFVIMGKPFGKQRPRFSRRGKFTTTYTPQKTVDYEQQVRAACIQAMQEQNFTGWFNDEGVFVNIQAFYEIPKSYNKKKVKQIAVGEILATRKPDWDNIGKIICDSLNEVAYKDDSQVICGQVMKMYSSEPRVEVEIGQIKLNKGEE